MCVQGSTVAPEPWPGRLGDPYKHKPGTICTLTVTLSARVTLWALA